MRNIIYADNAATTKLDIDAFEAMKPYLLGEYGNASQPYSFARNARVALSESRKIIADCIGADPEEIYFTSGGTESDNWAIKGVMGRDDNKLLLASSIEHHAVLNTCSSLEKNGITVQYLPVDRQGLIHKDIFCKYMLLRPKLVSVMLANNEIGTIEPISELAKIAHEYGALMHTDAVQAVGHIPIDVKELQVDMLSASGHKFNGPKGIGFLYVKKGTNIIPYADGGAQESAMRAGTENVAAIVAMAHALKKNCEEMTKVTAKLRDMENDFITALNNSGIDYVRNGSDNILPGNINISIRNANGEMLLHRLDLKGIYISTGSACDSINNKVSHVINSIQVPREYAEGTIRISFGRDNNIEDAGNVANAIVSIFRK